MIWRKEFLIKAIPAISALSVSIIGAPIAFSFTVVVPYIVERSINWIFYAPDDIGAWSMPWVIGIGILIASFVSFRVALHVYQVEIKLQSD